MSMGQNGATDAVAARLFEISDELTTVECRRSELLVERKRLALELLRAGMSEREVAGTAGVTGVAVHYWKAGL